MQAVICPVCDGSGKYKKLGEYEEKVCHGCGGKGWVEVHEQLYCVHCYPPAPTVIHPWVSYEITTTPEYDIC